MSPVTVFSPTGEALPPATSIGQHFTGEFPPARLSLAYRVALVATAAAMVLLPLVYLAVAAGAAWGVWWWLGAGLEVFKHSTSIWSLLLYLTPAITGGITVVFLFKPFFAPREKSSEPVAVDLAQEPVLREFLAQICRRTGVAMPASVHLNATVNASASFRRGWLSLGRRDLALTLGTPLIRGLTVRQLGGVIAHEFGHFAQRTGMFSQFLIRTINDWFAHVVFGRDRWDAWLIENSENNDWRVAAPLWCARGGVWGSRKILHGLLYVAHALSCWLSRQMEFDADYYAAHLQGAESFATTANAISLLAIAEQRANEDINVWWRDKRAVTDFARVVSLRRSGLPTELEAAFAKAQTEEKTRWHDTHPCMRDRIARARTLGTAGVLEHDGAATELFRDFAASSREVTAALYRHSVGDQLDKATPLSDDEIAQRIAGDDARAAALHRLTGSAIALDRPVLLTLAEIAPGAAGPHPTRAEHAKWFADEAERLRRALEADAQAYERLHELAGARRFIDCGIGVKPATFRLRASTQIALDEAQAETLRIRLEHDGLLTEAANRVRQRLCTFGRLAHEHAPRPEAERLRVLLETFASLSPLYTKLPQLLQLQSIVRLFAVNQAALAKDTRFVIAYDGVCTEARKALADALALAANIDDPLAEKDTPRTVADRLRNATTETDNLTVLTAQLGAAIRYYFQLLSECAALAEALEPEVNAS
ncbi:MAG: M48 family metalloprotease [Opitutae bacterium]|nr:M48 family metalloprotease [Opitutae bacterium]